MTPDKCPKFSTCSAPICPLDADWRERTHLRDERVCFYLRTSHKSPTRPNMDGGYTGEVEKFVAEHGGEIIALFPPIRRALGIPAKGDANPPYRKPYWLHVKQTTWRDKSYDD